MVDWDCPPADPPPVCVSVLLWLVVLSFVAEAEEVFELVAVEAAPGSGSEAAAAWTCARQTASDAIKTGKANQHRRGSHMRPPSAIVPAPARPRVEGFRSPRPGGAL
jgi:hypothetical protein